MNKTMSSKTLFLVLPLLLLLELNSWAQNLSSSRPAPRFYVALQIHRAQYTVIYKPAQVPGTIGPGPWRLSLGYQLQPRLAVEISGMYNYAKFNGSETGTTLNGQKIFNYSTDKNWDSALPILARYSLTHGPNSPLNIDVLLGVTLAKTHSENDFTNTLNGQIVQERHDIYNGTSFCWTAGAGFRYQFGYHWQAVGDWTVNRNTDHLPDYVSLQVLGRKSDLTYVYGLGVRYCFNVGSARKAKATEVAPSKQ